MFQSLFCFKCTILLFWYLNNFFLDSTADNLDTEEPITQLLDSSSNSLEECETFLLDDSFLEDKDDAVEDKFNSIDQIEKNVNSSFKCLETENVTESCSSSHGTEKINNQFILHYHIFFV